MAYTSEERRQKTYELALDLINEMAPGLPSLREIVDHICSKMEISRQAARRYLRHSIADGKIVELMPDPKWHVRWPQAERNGLFGVRLMPKLCVIGEKREAVRLILAAPRTPGRVRSVGPGSETYLTTTYHTSKFIRAALSMPENRRLL